MVTQNGDLLYFDKICKNFAGVRALIDVEFGIRQGEVHALVGENGAGKSTLMNVMKGVHQPDGGGIVYKGERVTVKNPHAASLLGINMVHQELNLVPDLTVCQNIMMGIEPTLGGIVVNHAQAIRRCEEILRELHCDFSAKAKVKSLSVAQMQMVAIARTLVHKSTVVAFDEPTASLSKSESDQLFKIIRKLRDAGTSIIYISHRMDEVYELADRVTVMRDGRYIATHNVRDIEKQDLIKQMVGRDISEYMHHPKDYSTDEIVLSVEGLCSRKGNLVDVSFSLRKGEILGLSGLVGAGRTELVRAIFGADKYDKGRITILGKEADSPSPRNSIRRGVCLLPEERKTQGFIGSQSNHFNIGLGSLDQYTRYGIVNHRGLRQNSQRFMNRLKVSPPGTTNKTKNLSGGNQQKVILAKWMSANARILIFDEPTRGLDVGARAEIYSLMNEFVGNGNSIIMISSDLPEVLGMSDRILVMHEGRITAELPSHGTSEETILQYAMRGV